MRHLFNLISILLILSSGSTDLFCQVSILGADIDGEANNDQSGISVSLSGDGTTVAIGAPYNDPDGNNRGHVRVFRILNGVWVQQGPDIDGEENNGFFGYSVSISADGTTVAAGAIVNDAGGEDRGHVRVYKIVNGIWMQQGTDIDGVADGDFFGHSVSLSADGTTVAIGAPNNDSGGNNRGQVRVYKIINGLWVQQGAVMDGEEDNEESGFSISLSGDGTSVAIGAYRNNAGDIGVSFIGHVRVYKMFNGVWVQQGADIDGKMNSEFSGYSVSLSADGATVAIGAPRNDGGGDERGQVRVYKLINGVWIQQGSDIDGEEDADWSGHSVSLSADGNTVAIGAPFNAGGTGQGHVRVYRRVNGSWIKQGVDIDGEATGDLSGWAVSLSADGTTVAIGAPFNRFSGIEGGHVRVYSLCSPSTKFINAILAMVRQGHKAYVCHNGLATLKVDYHSFLFHLFHGDLPGKCGLNYCGPFEIRGDDFDDFIGTEYDKSEVEYKVLYPNPALHILNVKLPFHTDQAIQVQVYNSLGQSMINQPYYLSGKDHQDIPVNIQKLPQGLYFLKVSMEGYEVSKAFTKF